MQSSLHETQFGFSQLTKAATSFLLTAGTFALTTTFSSLLSRLWGGSSKEPPFSFFAAASDTVTSNPLASVGDQVAHITAWEVGRFDTPGWAYDVKVNDPYAYLADGPAGLQILNISTFNPITLVSTLPLNVGWMPPPDVLGTGGSARQLVLLNQTAFVAGDTAGLWVVDVTHPQAPVEQGRYGLPNGRPVTRVNGVEGTLFYADNNRPTVQIQSQAALNVSLIGTGYQEERGVTDIFPLGQAMYLAYPGIGVVRIDTTTFPKVTTLPLTASLTGIAIEGHTCYVAAGSQGMHVVDISEPHQPVWLVTYHTLNSVNAIQVQGNQALVVGSAGFELFDISQTGEIPPLIGSTDQGMSGGTANALSIRDPYVFIANGPGGVVVIDITNATAPQWVSSFSAANQAYDLVLDPSFAYVANGLNGLQVLDARDPKALQAYGSYAPIGSNTQAIWLSEGTLYMADGGLKIVDVTDPSRPSLLGSYTTSNTTVDLFFEQPFVYLLDQTQGLWIFDVSNAFYPQWLGTYAIPAGGSALTYAQGLTYVISNTGLVTLDVPFWETRIAKPTTAMQVAATLDTVYIATFEQLLYVMNQANISQPNLIATYPMQGSAREMMAYNDYVFVAEGKQGIEVIDVHQPDNPRLAGQFKKNLTDVRGLTRQGNYLYVADDAAGLVVLQTDIQPVIQTNTLMIYNHETVVFTPNALRAVDPDTLASDVTWTVGNIQHGRFENQGKPGIALTAFTLADLQEQRIQFVHDGQGQPPTYQIQISDGWLSDGPYTPLVYFNEPPVWVSPPQITLQVGKPQIVTTIDLNALPFAQSTDASEDTRLIFDVNFLQNAYFSWVTQSNTSIRAFTKQDLINGQVLLSYGGGEVSPVISLILSHREISLPVRNVTLVVPTDDPPEFDFLPCIVVNEGETTVITSGQLSGRDPDNGGADNALRFDINTMAFGYFSSHENANLITARFNQSQVIYQIITFTHTGGQEDVPSYQIELTKVLPTGIQVSTGFIQGTVNYNRAPRLITNTLTLYPGETVWFTTAQLSATDKDDNETLLTFIPFNVTHGHFLLKTANNTAVMNFTQGEVMQGQISFVHDGSLEAPAYRMAVHDKRIQTAPSAATITFLTSHQEESLSATRVAGPVAGSLALAGLLTVGFFAGYRWHREQQSRRTHPFAHALEKILGLGIKDFNSVQGKHYIDVVDTLFEKLSAKGVLEDYLSGMHQLDLVQAVADHVRPYPIPKKDRRDRRLQVDDLKNSLEVLVEAVVSNHPEMQEDLQPKPLEDSERVNSRSSSQ